MDYYNIFVLCFYMGLLLIISVVANKKSTSSSVFLLGGRSLNSFTVAISAGASDMSGWILLGLPGAVYAFGLNQIWIIIGLIIGSYCNWLFISGKIREKSHALGSITIPDFIAKNVENGDKTIRIVSSIMILIFFTMYVASGFVSGAKVFSYYFHINYHFGLLLAFIAIVVTTFIGGFLAVSWSEVFQGMIMVKIIMFLPLVALIYIPDLSHFLQNKVLAKDPNMLNIFYHTSPLGIISLIAWGLGYFGQPHILVKFMALKDKETAIKARKIAILWMILGLAFAVIIGVIGAGVFSHPSLPDPELVILSLSSMFLHPIFIGLVIIAILSAVFSTSTAQLLVISSVFTNDLKLVKQTITMNRIIIIIVGCLALLLSLNPNSNILSMVSYAWAGFGASFGPIILISLYKRVLNISAILGMISGGSCVILWNVLRNLLPHIQIFHLYELLPAFFLSFIIILIVNQIGLKLNKI